MHNLGKMRLVSNEFRLLAEPFLRPCIKDEDVAFFLQPKSEKVQYFLFSDEKLLVCLLFWYFPCLFGVLKQMIANVNLYF